MDSQAEADRTPADKALCPGPLSRAVGEGEARSYVDREMLHVRAVEFVAKAGLSSQLRDSIDRPVLKFLARQTGFGGAMVLTPHKEPRRILVFSFWRTERGCRENEWDSPRRYGDTLSRSLTPSRASRPTGPIFHNHW